MSVGRWILAVVVIAAVATTAVVVDESVAHHQTHPARRIESAAHQLARARHHPAAPLTKPLVRSASWEQTSLGYRLRVRPSAYGRQNAIDAPPQALSEAIATAGPQPLSLTASMRDSLTKQLRCHAEFAATKPRWDLEAWRPDVSYTKVIAALCNP